jgi:hypothetical protein
MSVKSRILLSVNILILFQLTVTLRLYRATSVGDYHYHHHHVEGVRLCLWPAATSGPIVHLPGDICEVIMSTEKNWFIHQNSLAILPAESSGRKQEEWVKGVRFCLCEVYHSTCKWFFTCHKILWHWASGFTSPLKEGMLRIFVALKYPSPRLGLNPRTLGPVASTPTITPLRWQWEFSFYSIVIPTVTSFE